MNEHSPFNGLVPWNGESCLFEHFADLIRYNGRKLGMVSLGIV